MRKSLLQKIWLGGIGILVIANIAFVYNLGFSVGVDHALSIEVPAAEGDCEIEQKVGDNNATSVFCPVTEDGGGFEARMRLKEGKEYTGDWSSEVDGFDVYWKGSNGELSYILSDPIRFTGYGFSYDYARNDILEYVTISFGVSDGGFRTGQNYSYNILSDTLVAVSRGLHSSSNIGSKRATVRFGVPNTLSEPYVFEYETEGTVVTDILLNGRKLGILPEPWEPYATSFVREGAADPSSNTTPDWGEPGLYPEGRVEIPVEGIGFLIFSFEERRVMMSPFSDWVSIDEI